MKTITRVLGITALGLAGLGVLDEAKRIAIHTYTGYRTEQLTAKPERNQADLDEAKRVTNLRVKNKPRTLYAQNNLLGYIWPK